MLCEKSFTTKYYVHVYKSVHVRHLIMIIMKRLKNWKMTLLPQVEK